MEFWNRLAGYSLAIVVVCAAGFASAQEPTAGVVRISDLPDVGEQMKMHSYEVVSHDAEQDCETETGACESSTCEQTCEGKSHKVCLHRYTLRNIYWHFKYGCPWFHCHDDCDSKYKNCPREHCPHCKHGHCPYHGKHGNFHGGKGWGHKAKRGVACFGAYTIAYPVNPQYCDGRDGGLYAAQGYGINVTVPLAPNVGAAYNYGWGVPSSRLSPVSNTLPIPPAQSVLGPARYPVISNR